MHSKYCKTRRISNTWLVQTKFNISDQSVNEVSAERLQRERKHFLQSVMVSVAVSKLAETDLVFVQSDAKTNSVYYCENVLEQGLLPAICCISNNNFVVYQERAPAHCRLGLYLPIQTFMDYVMRRRSTVCGA